MNNTKEIDFGNDELIENEKTIVTYSGSLFQKGSDEVYIVYGFGKQWNNTSEQKMQKAGNGFFSEITLSGSDSFNFCFRNSNYEWDNNFGNDYCVSILPPLPFSSDVIDSISTSTSDSQSTEIPQEAEIVQKHIQEYDINQILDEILDSIHHFSNSEESGNFEFISTPETSFANIEKELDKELSSIYTERQSHEEAFSKVLCDLRELNKILDHKAALEFSENTVIEPESTSEIEPTLETTLTPEFISKINLSAEINQFIEEKQELSKQPETVSTEDLYSTLSIETATEESQTQVIKTDEEKQKDIAVTLVEHSELVTRNSFLRKLLQLKKQIKLAFYKLSTALPKLFGEKDSDS